MKLALIAASTAGVLLAGVGIGYVDGIFTRDELIATVAALAVGAYLWNKIDNL